MVFWILGVMFSRQPTEEILDRKKLRRNPRQPAKRRRKEMLKNFFAQMQNKMQDEEGQGLVEYVLIIAVIGLVVALAMPTLTDAISSLFVRIAAALA